MRTRSRGVDIGVGLAAALSLAALVAGVPVLLLAVSGPPIPRSLPGLSLLTRPLGVHSVLAVCAAVVWLAWLQLLWCVGAEVAAAVRNSGMPHRVPLAGGTQALVHRLVSATLVLSATAVLPAGVAAQNAVAAATAPVAAGTPPGQPRVAAHPGRTGSLPPLSGARGAGSAAGGADGRVAASASARQAAPPEASARAGGSGAGGSGAGGSGAGGSQAARGTGGAGTAGRVPFSAAVTGLVLADAASPASPAIAAGAGRPAGDRHPEKIYVVRPPSGRFHESLWEIAERFLGDGRRYREIFELNRDRPQPDGSMLTIASLIRPGWILRMPPDAHGPGIKVVEAGAGGRPHRGAPGHPHSRPGGAAPLPGWALADTAPGHAGLRSAGGADPARRPEGSPAQTASPRPHLSSSAAVPSPPRLPGTGAPSASRAGSAGAGGQVAQSRAGVAAGLVVAGLLAATILAALERRRRQQWARRLPGMLAAPPDPGAARAEVELRREADPDAALMLDAALRELGASLAEQGRPAPALIAAHLGDSAVDLWIAQPDPDPPEPWTAVSGGRIWRLALGSWRDGAAAAGRAPEGPGVPAPYPGLVPIGEDAAGEVLVDLTAAPGVVAVAGPDQVVRAVFGAIAAALASACPSAPMRVVLVGFGADVAALAPDHVQAVSALADGCALVSRWAADEQVGGRACLISVTPPSPADRRALLALGGKAVCLISGEVPGAAWNWEVGDDGRLWTGELGLEVGASMLWPDAVDAVAGLFQAASTEPGVRLGPPSPDAAPAAHLTDDATVAVEIAVLGPAQVLAPGLIHPNRLPLATEIVVYLATHPGGVAPNTLAAAVWPRGVAPQARDAVLERVADWLGADGIGRPHLAADAGGRLRLGSQVRVDWQVFQALLARAEFADEERWLSAALRLIRGPFLAGRAPGRYSWLAAETLEAEVAARVADAAHRLCSLRLGRGDPLGAMAAARSGLALARYDESLWRDLLTAAHATGEDRVLRDAVDHVRATAAADHVRPVMAPQTQSLISDLLAARSPREAPI